MERISASEFPTCYRGVEYSIILRSANPTFDEGLVFARYLDQAFEGLFRLTLGPRAEDIVATAYTQPDHDFSYWKGLHEN